MRQTKNDYTDEDLERIKQWARNGLTITQIAKNLKVARRTFYRLIEENKKLEEALNTGREIADVEVEGALFKSATGYYVDEQYIDNHGVKKVFKKYVYPNVTAQIFWLKNRKPKNWREKQEIELESTEKVQLIIKNDL